MHVCIHTYKHVSGVQVGFLLEIRHACLYFASQTHLCELFTRRYLPQASCEHMSIKKMYQVWYMFVKHIHHGVYACLRILVCM
jgi:hypothetical protein